MLRAARAAALTALLVASVWADAHAQSAVTYRLSFPDRVHHVMDVEATFADLPAGPLQLRMSRSSPGRYSLHEFAKNVFDVRATDGSGQPLTVIRASPHQWDIRSHPSTVRLTYRVFGDRVDGTYLGVDTTHAHINMPAAIMWARGLELRPVIVRFEPPGGSGWNVATQLLPGADPLTFSAGSLQYLMDSPAELSAFSTRTFTLADGVRTPVFRITAHHDGTDADLDALARDVQLVVREERGVFGEFPAFDGNTYTFIADYLPSDPDDAMEHRNSTAITAPAQIRAGRTELLRTIAHEFFHTWNVERIRPRSLEPFNLDDVNMSGELWFAEGFSDYYATLALHRAGLTALDDFAAAMGEAIDTVATSSARRLRTAEEMSQLAPFTDAAISNDPTNVGAAFLSYYTWGHAIALGLDLTLRDRSDGRVTLDDYMRAMWEKFGKPGGKLAGYVDQPYTIDDAREVLASVSGDPVFAREFFARYIQGHDVVDYARLLARAGFVLKPAAPGQAFAGAVGFGDAFGGARIESVVPFDSPAYRAGLDLDDVIVGAGGATIRSASDFHRVLQSKRPGDVLPLVLNRRGSRVSTSLTLVEDPSQRMVPVEQTGQSLTDAQRRFRAAWLSSAARNAF